MSQKIVGTYSTNNIEFKIYSDSAKQLYQERKTGLKDGYARLYMYVTNDIYELPIAVCTTPAELAEAIGCKKRTVIEELSRWRAGKRNTCFRTVDVPIEDTDFKLERVSG